MKVIYYLKYLLAALLVAVNFAGCGLYLDRANHVLSAKSLFISAKSFAPNGVSFAQQFVFDRPTLAQDRLNMTAWDGHNEVIWNIPQDWEEVSFDADVRYGAYLWIFVVNSESGRIGFRLSHHSRFSSGFYVLTKDKEFLKSENFDFSEPPGPVHFKLSYRNEKLVLNIQGRDIYGVDVKLQNRLLSFGSSANGVTLDNFSVGEQRYSENFSPEVQPVNWVIAAVLTVMNSFLLYFAFRRNKFSVQQMIGTALFVTAVMAFWVWVDKEKLSGRYSAISHKNWRFDFTDNPQDIFEIVRKRILFTLYTVAGDRKNAFLARAKDYTYSFVIPENTSRIPEFAKKVFHPNGLEKNGPETRRKYMGMDGKIKFLENYDVLSAEPVAGQRVVFLGSSQTYGGGAGSPEQIYVEQTSRRFAACSKNGFASLNISSIGDETVFFLSAYKDLLQYWKPTLTVVSLEAYEKNIQFYKNRMEELVKLNLEKGIPVAFIKEAFSPEAGRNIYFQSHQVIDELSQKYGLQVLNMDAYMNLPEIYDSGLLWLDSAHLDQAGHNRAAAWLFSELKERKLAACR